jgi:hypothetical protein
MSLKSRIEKIEAAVMAAILARRREIEKRIEPALDGYIEDLRLRQGVELSRDEARKQLVEIKLDLELEMEALRDTIPDERERKREALINCVINDVAKRKGKRLTREDVIRAFVEIGTPEFAEMEHEQRLQK